jgi:energy-coupling factor transport system substrate-specific component
LDRQASSLSSSADNPGPTPPSRPGVSTILVVLASLSGLIALIYPLVIPLLPVPAGAELSRNVATPLVFTVVAVLSLGTVIAELAGGSPSHPNAAKVAALLGALVAIDACLRLVPSLGGASPIFMLIIITGAVFGARLGFLVGSLTLLLSAFLTGGIGPWLPYQMLGAGWVGLGAGFLPGRGASGSRVLTLAVYGIVSAIFYGVMINLYSWPFAAPDVEQAAGLFWSPGLSFGETLDRYARFYLVTSLSHDAFRAAGNAILILLLGGSIIRALDRARLRFSWQALHREDIGAENDKITGTAKPFTVSHRS